MFQEPRCLFALRMPQSLKDAIDARAYQEGLSSSDLIRRVLADYTNAHTALPTHGNTRYTSDSERALARKRQRQQAKRRAVLLKQLGV